MSNNVRCQKPSDLAISLSPKGYAGVSAVYKVSLSEGANEVVLEGLPATLIDHTLDLDDEASGGAGELELNQITILPATESLEEVLQLINQQHPQADLKTEKQGDVSGIVRILEHGQALVQDSGGIRLVQNIIGYKLTAMPDGLTDTPYLALDVTAAAAGEYQLVITYNCTKIGYRLSHLGIYDEAASTLLWKTSAVIPNGSGNTFEKALLYLVAGDTGEEAAELYSDDVPMESAPRAYAASAMPMGGGRGVVRKSATQESLGGNAASFKVPNRVTLRRGAKAEDKPGKTKVTIAQSDGPFSVKRRNLVESSGLWWAHDGYDSERPVKIELKFDNTKEIGIGRIIEGPLTFKVRNKDGFLQPSGGDSVSDKAVGDEVETSPGTEFDLTFTARQLTHKKGEKKEIKRVALPDVNTQIPGRMARQWRVTYRTEHTCGLQYELRNGKETGAVFVIEEAFNEYNTVLQIEGGKHEFAQVDAAKHEISVSVGAGKTETVNFTVLHVVERDETETQEIEVPSLPHLPIGQLPLRPLAGGPTASAFGGTPLAQVPAFNASVEEPEPVSMSATDEEETPMGGGDEIGEGGAETLE